jgi:3-deoxy-D-manno-octulosonate 8-phosphate phosphatase (KDO 8-P phosphatase)
MQVLILDVDGVLTTGQFIYNEDGKKFKVFGPDDNDATSLLGNSIEVRCVTGDKSGFDISQRRVVEDMNLKLDLVSTTKRVDWIKSRYDLSKVIYMGDGIFDHYVFQEVGYSIAPSNAGKIAKNYADFVTQQSGGDRAVAEACLHVLDKFFDAYDPNKPLDKKQKYSGKWIA